MKIGIDIGRVIIVGGAHNSKDKDTEFVTATDVDAVKATPEVPGATAAIKDIVDAGHEVWLVSKCKENMQRKSRKWLKHHRFFEDTGVHRSRLLFCYFRSDKAIIAKGLGLEAFIDDRLDCILPMKSISSKRRFWFGNEGATEIPDGVTHTPTWNDVLERMETGSK